MRSLLLSLAVVSFGAAAHAQDDYAQMGEALTMLETLASRALTQYGVEADVMSLSLSQVAGIVQTIENDDTTSENALKATLQKIVSGS